MMARCDFQPQVDTHEIFWSLYQCTACGSLVTIRSRVGVNPRRPHEFVTEAEFPSQKSISFNLPEAARNYLTQALNALGEAADGAVMLASSAIDAMLKDRGYSGDPSLHNRINAAVKDGILTKDMGEWAHHVRHASNFPRHADKARPHATKKEAEIIVDFAEALGEFLYVLPAKARSAIADAKKEKKAAK